MINLVIWIRALFSDQSAPISSPHFSSSLLWSPWSLLYFLCVAIVDLVRWRRMTTQSSFHVQVLFYYFLEIFKSLLIWPKQGVKEQNRAIDCSGPVFRTHFNSRIVRVTWLKQSKQSHGLRLIWSSMAVNQTSWLLLYLSISLMIQDLI